MYVLVLQPSVKLDIVYMHVAQDHGSGQVILWGGTTAEATIY